MNKDKFDFVIPLLNALINQGVCHYSPALVIFEKFGLWHYSVDKQTLIASAKLLSLRQQFKNTLETVATVLACDHDIQSVWASYVAEQLKDAGNREDIAALVSQISNLGLGAKSVQQSLCVVPIESSVFESLEMSVFGCSGKQSIALPKLLRVLNQAALLLAWADEHKTYQLNILDPIETDKPQTAWIARRLLALPGMYCGSDFVLTGRLTSDSDQGLNWLLKNPWAFLLAQLVYVQDVWLSEQIAGGVRLELDGNYKDQFYSPSSIQIVVITREEQEVSCGSLAEFLCRVLKVMKMVLLTPLPADQQISMLNQKLASVVSALLEHSVWRFHQSNKSESACYRIHPAFEPIPNRRLGTIQFSRPGELLAGVIRQEAEQWAYERLNKSLGNIGND